MLSSEQEVQGNWSGSSMMLQSNPKILHAEHASLVVSDLNAMLVLVAWEM